jgi:hypothetical protein
LSDNPSYCSSIQFQRTGTHCKWLKRVNENTRFSGTRGGGGGDDDDDGQVQLAWSIPSSRRFWLVLLLESAAKTTRRYELRADKKDLVKV